MENQSFYMIYLDGCNTPTCKHADLNSAENEAKRLAEKFNKKAFILCTLKSFEINKFVEKDCRPSIQDDLPF